jgi:polysaccharide export outer membrane protein
VRKIRSVIVSTFLCILTSFDIGYCQKLISAGDEVELSISEDEIFSRNYIISKDGYIKIPYINKIYVNGLTTKEASNSIKNEFVKSNIFRPHKFSLSILIRRQGPISVAVSGEVFNEGIKTINKNKAIMKSGDSEFTIYETDSDSLNRYLSNALKLAKGVTPYADLSKIEIMRNGELLVHDITGLMTGSSAQDIELINGDIIYVPSTNKFNKLYAKESALTLDQIDVYIASNTVKEKITIPYGLSLSHIMPSTGCIDSNKTLSLMRSMILIRGSDSKNRYLNQEKSIRKIVNSNDNMVNIRLQPNDIIICSNSLWDKISSGVLKISDVVKQPGIIYSDYVLK